LSDGLVVILERDDLGWPHYAFLCRPYYTAGGPGCAAAATRPRDGALPFDRTCCVLLPSRLSPRHLSRLCGGSSTCCCKFLRGSCEGRMTFRSLLVLRHRGAPMSFVFCARFQVRTCAGGGGRVTVMVPRTAESDVLSWGIIAPLSNPAILVSAITSTTDLTVVQQPRQLLFCSVGSLCIAGIGVHGEDRI
jgi:hypothetical protein